jgi:anti-anti-sigma factor
VIDDARLRSSADAHPLHGEYDLANAGELAFRLQRIVGETRGDVLLDCSDLRFWDSSAVVVLADIHERLVLDGRRLLLRGLAPTPRRVLEVLGLTEWLEDEAT